MEDTNKILFAISVEDLQCEAIEKIGRKLTTEEIEVAKKCIHSGLLTSIDIVYDTIFKEMIM